MRVGAAQKDNMLRAGQPDIADKLAAAAQVLPVILLAAGSTRRCLLARLFVVVCIPASQSAVDNPNV